VANAAGFLRFNLTNSGIQDPEQVPGGEGDPATRNFPFSDVVMNGGTIADGGSVPAERPLDGFSLARVSGVAAQGVTLANVRNAELRDINVTGIAGPKLATSNVTGVGLEGAALFRPPSPPEPRPRPRP
jgi:hypothetical protein